MDVHLWFHGTSHGTEKAKTEGALRVSNLSSESSEGDVRRLLGRYYSTVKTVTMARGSAIVTFGRSGERDKALVELQGTQLNGARLSLAKYEGSRTSATAPRKRGPNGELTDDSIQAVLLERDAARRRRDYAKADALVGELRTCGILLDTQAGTWRCSDGRTGMLPAGNAPGGSALGVSNGLEAGTTAGAPAPACILYARLAGESSLGTHTLKRILTPFNVSEVSGTRDGYAACVFSDAGSAATALSLTHYTPVGTKITLLSAERYCAATGRPPPSSAAALPEGWVMGWSAEYQRPYYTYPAANLTQWEPPAVQPSQSTSPALPAGWAMGWSYEHGCCYYVNGADGTTQWQAPVVALVAYSDEEEGSEDGDQPPPARAHGAGVVTEGSATSLDSGPAAAAPTAGLPTATR